MIKFISRKELKHQLKTQHTKLAESDKRCSDLVKRNISLSQEVSYFRDRDKRLIALVENLYDLYAVPAEDRVTFKKFFGIV